MCLHLPIFLSLHVRSTFWVGGDDYAEGRPVTVTEICDRIQAQRHWSIMHVVCNVPVRVPLSIPINKTRLIQHNAGNMAPPLWTENLGVNNSKRALWLDKVSRKQEESLRVARQCFFFFPFLLSDWFSLRLWHILLLPCQCQLVPQVNVEICCRLRARRIWAISRCTRMDQSSHELNQDKNTKRRQMCKTNEQSPPIQKKNPKSLWSIEIK